VRVRVLSPAIDEIAEAAAWFNSQRTGLGDEFWRLVDDILAQIEANPHRFGKSDFATPAIDLRCALVRRFKYVIHFAIESEEVQVISVAHGARRPGYWRRRAK
jgi:toxin ParE1/3/4